MSVNIVSQDTTDPIPVTPNTPAFVEEGVTAAGGFYSSDSAYLSVVVKGNVAGLSHGVQFGYANASSHDLDVTIFSGGTVSGFGSGAITLTGYRSSVQNAGEVWGGDYGIYLNTTVSAEDTRSSIGNTGSILGQFYGVYVVGTENVTVTNSGLIHGDRCSFIDYSGGAAQLITNNGAMEGDVLLGGGKDVYSGAKGSLTGFVFGGKGSDTIKTGADDDQIHGGRGLDRLAGGVGEDTFFFDTAPYGKNNADTIADFNPENDTIALAYWFFGLHPSRFPSSSFLANKDGQAANAGDHFLYNTTDGNLYYDADGSKGGSTAELLATFLHHPHITADDFIVI